MSQYGDTQNNEFVEDIHSATLVAKSVGSSNSTTVYPFFSCTVRTCERTLVVRGEVCRQNYLSQRKQKQKN
jgi:hypothetical protein